MASHPSMGSQIVCRHYKNLKISTEIGAPGARTQVSQFRQPGRTMVASRMHYRSNIHVLVHLLRTCPMRHCVLTFEGAHAPHMRSPLRVCACALQGLSTRTLQRRVYAPHGHCMHAPWGCCVAYRGGYFMCYMSFACNLLRMARFQGNSSLNL